MKFRIKAAIMLDFPYLHIFMQPGPGVEFAFGDRLDYDYLTEASRCAHCICCICPIKLLDLLHSPISSTPIVRH